MKTITKSINELPYKWKYADPICEYIIIDQHNSNFHESDGWYCARRKVIYTKSGAFVRFENVKYIIATD